MTVLYCVCLAVLENAQNALLQVFHTFLRRSALPIGFGNFWADGRIPIAVFVNRWSYRDISYGDLRTDLTGLFCFHIACVLVHRPHRVMNGILRSTSYGT
jgi:hypothetical protein